MAKRMEFLQRSRATQSGPATWPMNPRYAYINADNVSIRGILLLLFLSSPALATTTCYNSLMTVSLSMDEDVHSIQTSSLTEFQPVVCDEKFGLGVNICGVNCRFYMHIVSSKPEVYCRRMCTSRAQVRCFSLLTRSKRKQTTSTS